MNFEVPQFLQADLAIKFEGRDLQEPDLAWEMAIYAHHITTVILEVVRPARGHGARKKRVYTAVEARMLELQHLWLRREGCVLDTLEPVVGAWEIAGGMEHGEFREVFDAQPEEHKPLLMRIGAICVVPRDETFVLMDRAHEDWTVMDRYDAASLACYDQLVGQT